MKTVNSSSVSPVNNDEKKQCEELYKQIHYNKHKR